MPRDTIAAWFETTLQLLLHVPCPAKSKVTIAWRTAVADPMCLGMSDLLCDTYESMHF
jgi:hypothetical protein